MSTNRRSSTLDMFDSGKSNLKTLLEEIHRGDLKLPNFQRSWKWPNDHIKSLIASIAAGHPIGAAMFMETGGEMDFEHRAFEGAEDTADANTRPAKLALDGQQRLTSSYQACFSKKPVKVKVNRGATYYLYYFDMEKSINLQYPLKSAIIDIQVSHDGRQLNRRIEDHTQREFQFEHGIFPINEIFSSDDWDSEYHAYWDKQEFGERRNAALAALRDFRAAIINSFVGCQFPIISIRRGIKPEGICTVYENLNSKGVPLDGFDLLIAHYAAKKYDLRADWFGDGSSGYANYLKTSTKGILAGVTAKQFLQAVSMAVGLGENKKILATNRSSMLDLRLDDYLSKKDRVRDGFIEAYRFLIHSGIYSAKSVPSLALIAAYAAIASSIGDSYRDHEVRAKIGRWFWCVVYGNAYASGMEQAMALDIPEVVAWLKGAPKEPRSVTSTFVHEHKFISMKSGSMFQNALTASMLKVSPVDFATGHKVDAHVYAEGQYDLHHIFPKKWCKDNDIPEEMYDSIINKTPLSSKTNRYIGGNAPSSYLSAIENGFNVAPEHLDYFLSTHGINPRHLRADDFYAFFAERKEFLIGKIEKETGKSVVRGETQDLDAPYGNLEPGEVLPADCEFRMSSRGGLAYIKRDSRGFTVIPGSLMSADVAPSLPPSGDEQREAMIADGYFSQQPDGRWLLSQEVHFSAISNLAQIFSGGKASGSTKLWRDRDGNPVSP